MPIEVSPSSSTPVPTVYVVDDDDSMRRSLCRLLEAAEIPVAEFASAAEFLDSNSSQTAGCLLLDLSMPGFSGLELQEILVRTGRALPIVFLTGRGDVPSSVRAMKSGAVDFLIKPVPKAQLIAAIKTAFARDQAARTVRAEQNEMRRRLSRLTPREAEVVRLVARGLLNKQIASVLGTVEKTVKVHRSRALTKLEISSVADLVRLLERAQMPAEGDAVEELQTA
ncbi:MAG TPA: response regulator [Candidatus Didemnitutus sp.]|nr:response regulator [Candidatus Didemnitutus sp.]